MYKIIAIGGKITNFVKLNLVQVIFMESLKPRVNTKILKFLRL